MADRSGTTLAPLYIATLLAPWCRRSGWVGNAWHLGRNCLARPTDKIQKIRRKESEMHGIRHPFLDFWRH